MLLTVNSRAIALWAIEVQLSNTQYAVIRRHFFGLLARMLRRGADGGPAIELTPDEYHTLRRFLTAKPSDVTDVLTYAFDKALEAVSDRADQCPAIIPAPQSPGPTLVSPPAAREQGGGEA